MVACGLLGAGCRDTRDQSACVTFERLVADLAVVDGLEVGSSTRDEVLDAVDDALDSANQLRETSDTTDAHSIEALSAALEELRRVVRGIRDDRDPSTWEPLVHDSIDDVDAAAHRVAVLFEPDCPT